MLVDGGTFGQSQEEPPLDHFGQTCSSALPLHAERYFERAAALRKPEMWMPNFLGRVVPRLGSIAEPDARHVRMQVAH